MRKVDVTVVVDFVHVREYLGEAALCFFREADPAAEAWVANTVREILRGTPPSRRGRSAGPRGTVGARSFGLPKLQLKRAGAEVGQKVAIAGGDALVVRKATKHVLKLRA